MKNTIRLLVGLTLLSSVALIVPNAFFAFEIQNKSDIKSNYLAKLPDELHKKTKTEIVFVGDIMLDRHVELRMEEFGEDYIFASTTEIFAKSDAVIANLEGPIVDVRKRVGLNSMQFSFATSVVPLLKKYGVTHVSLANNHTLDKGRDYLEFTRGVLSEYSIKSFGDPLSVNENTYIKQNVGKHDFVFLGLNETYGVLDIASSTDLVSKLRQEKSSVIIIPVIHWGEEYSLTNNVKQQKIAYALIDAGADVIIGHHPHVVQNIEKYKGKIIFYSLGNFIFDQYFSNDTKSGLAVRMIVEDRKISYRLMPIYAPRSNPSLMNESENFEFLRNLSLRSSSDIRSEILLGVIR